MSALFPPDQFTAPGQLDSISSPVSFVATRKCVWSCTLILQRRQVIEGKKLLFVSQRKLTASPDYFKNDMTEFRPPFPEVYGRVGGCIVF